MDGYGGYPTGYPPNSGPGYNEPQMQRPPSQSNSQSPHPGKMKEKKNFVDVKSMVCAFERTFSFEFD